MSSVTQRGMLAQQVGVGRPASFAAAAMVGTICRTYRFRTGHPERGAVGNRTGRGASMAGAIAAMHDLRGGGRDLDLPAAGECFARVADGFALERVASGCAR